MRVSDVPCDQSHYATDCTSPGTNTGSKCTTTHAVVVLPVFTVFPLFRPARARALVLAASSVHVPVECVHRATSMSRLTLAPLVLALCAASVHAIPIAVRELVQGTVLGESFVSYEFEAPTDTATLTFTLTPLVGTDVDLFISNKPIEYVTRGRSEWVSANTGPVTEEITIEQSAATDFLYYIMVRGRVPTPHTRPPHHAPLQANQRLA
ncbi:hypothetical protein EON66_04210 [archaeon]|nr:MAG: hypothetical protein EON66_04210 [archaeon]